MTTSRTTLKTSQKSLTLLRFIAGFTGEKQYQILERLLEGEANALVKLLQLSQERQSLAMQLSLRRTPRSQRDSPPEAPPLAAPEQP